MTLLVLEIFSLPDHPLGKGAADQIETLVEVGIIPEVLAGNGVVQTVMNVIAPLGVVEPGRTIIPALEPAGLIVGILGYEMDEPAIGGDADLLGQVLQHMPRTIVADFMHSIEAQA